MWCRYKLSFCDAQNFLHSLFIAPVDKDPIFGMQLRC